MDKKEAEKIVNLYGFLMSENNLPFKYISKLKYSKEEIKEAFFVFIRSVLDESGTLSSSLGSSLVNSYSALDIFIDDKEADRLNNICLLVRNKKLDYGNSEDEKMINEYLSKFSVAAINQSYSKEINDFIRDCYKEKGINFS